MSEVLGLDGKPVNPEPEYNTDVVSLLETALVDAKKYKSPGVAVILITNQSDTDGTSFDADIYWHGRRLTLLAGAARLVHRLNAKCDEAMEVIT